MRNSVLWTFLLPGEGGQKSHRLFSADGRETKYLFTVMSVVDDEVLHI